MLWGPTHLSMGRCHSCGTERQLRRLHKVLHSLHSSPAWAHTGAPPQRGLHDCSCCRGLLEGAVAAGAVGAPAATVWCPLDVAQEPALDRQKPKWHDPSQQWLAVRVASCV